MKLRHRSKKNKNSDNMLIYYNLSYNKFKYWFSVFYILVSVIIISVPINVTDWRLLFDRRNIIKINENLDKVEGLIIKVDAFIFNEKSDIDTSLIIKNDILGKMEYINHKTPFVWDNTEKKYCKKKRDVLEKICIELSNKGNQNIQDFLSRDSTFLREKVIQYKKKFNERKNIVKNKNSLARAMEDTLISELNRNTKNLYDIILDSMIVHDFFIKLNILKNNLPIEFQSDIFQKLKDEYREKRNKIEEMNNKQMGKLPYIETTISLRIIFYIAIFIFLVLPLYLQILYLNYKIYVGEVTKNFNHLIRVPNFFNFSRIIGLKHFFVFDIFRILFIIIIPFAIYSASVYLVCQFSILWLLLIIPIIVYFLLIFMSTKYGRLIRLYFI